VVGCDSPSTDKPFFPLVIVVLRTGAGGRFFLKKMHYPDNYLKRLHEYQLEAAHFAGSIFIVRAGVDVARNTGKRIRSRPPGF